MYIIDVKLISNMSPYAVFWSTKITQSPRLLQSVNCPECQKALRRSYTNNKFILDEGVLPDIVYPDFNVSEKFRTAWLKSGLTGIEDFLPLPLYQRRNKRYVAVKQPYYQVVLNVPHLKVDLRKSGMIDNNSIFAYNGDEVVVPEGKHLWIYWQCPVCGYTDKTFSSHRDERRGVYWRFPENLVYSGSTDEDIFTFMNVFNCFKYGIIGDRYYFVSDRFIDFIKENQLTNLYAFTPEEFRTVYKLDSTTERYTPIYTDPTIADIDH